MFPLQNCFHDPLTTVSRAFICLKKTASLCINLFSAFTSSLHSMLWKWFTGNNLILLNDFGAWIIWAVIWNFLSLIPHVLRAGPASAISDRSQWNFHLSSPVRLLNKRFSPLKGSEPLFQRSDNACRNNPKSRSGKAVNRQSVEQRSKQCGRNRDCRN